MGKSVPPSSTTPAPSLPRTSGAFRWWGNVPERIVWSSGVTPAAVMRTSALPSALRGRGASTSFRPAYPVNDSARMALIIAELMVFSFSCWAKRAAIDTSSLRDVSPESAYNSVGRHSTGYERQGRTRAIDVVLHRGRSAHPDRPDNFSVHLNGEPSSPRRHTRKRGDAGQKRRVALDKVEKVLRGDAEQSCIRLILRNLDAEDRGPIHPAKGLEVTPVIENRYVLANANFSGFRHRCMHHFLC